VIEPSKPVTPQEAVRDAVEWYGAEGHYHRQALDAQIDVINKRLRSEIAKCHTVGDTAGVEIDLPGVTQMMLLDLVLTYREAGWNVCYGCEKGTGPYLVIGIDMRG